MRLSRDHRDAIEAYAENIMRSAHRGLWIALALYACLLSYLCWRLA